MYGFFVCSEVVWEIFPHNFGTYKKRSPAKFLIELNSTLKQLLFNNKWTGDVVLGGYVQLDSFVLINFL